MIDSSRDAHYRTIVPSIKMTRLSRKQAAAMADADAPLEGWVACQADTGAYYYFNTLSGETSWELPAHIAAQVGGGSPEEPAPQRPRAEWVELVDDEGNPYFMDLNSGEVTFTSPVRAAPPPPSSELIMASEEAAGARKAPPRMVGVRVCPGRGGCGRLCAP